jgi:hypothetical protein
MEMRQKLFEMTEEELISKAERSFLHRDVDSEILECLVYLTVLQIKRAN